MIYLVSGFLYRNPEHKESELISVNEEFKDKNPKVARKKAFDYFKSLVEVLLESKGITYQNDKQAEYDLKVFFESNRIENHPILPHVSYNLDNDKLITISFSTKVKPDYVTKTGIKFYNDEKIIQAFGYQSELLEERIINNLQIEKK
ncbi:hypothetical protein LPB136_07095 [Tenacibaculum todarodis]|uniref:Uncharacterized protein n=1 Tax=Tenacibaculum todarodis TaxID=1850252 RepID=A0A1L3JJ42_9FLAO|nr:hypothetical protein [Tenacibaculum todarodis]APG65129.1 hypothetical protein LPB136_07095 [Tenacibaculum todarodis]